METGTARPSAFGAGWVGSGALNLADCRSDGFGMLAGNDRGRRAGDLPINNEIEADARKRLVEAASWWPITRIKAPPRSRPHEPCRLASNGGRPERSDGARAASGNGQRDTAQRR